VRLQKLDSGDRLTEVVLVPPAAEEEELADGAVPEVTPDVIPDAAVASAEDPSPAEETTDTPDD
jgi:DNA gyrase subunit A